MKKLLALTLAAGLAASANAAISIDALNAEYSEDFDSFTGSGFSATPSAGQLDSDAWAISGMKDGTLDFGGTQTGNDFALGTSSGGETQGGIYAFEVATDDFALGVQSTTDDFTPGDFTLKVLNNTGSEITQLDLSYEVWVYNDQNRGNSFNFSHSSDDNSYTAVAGLNVTSPEAKDGSPAWAKTDRSISLTGLSISDGDNYYFRWTGNDAGGTGSRDEFALDDISMTAIPEPATAGLLGLGALALTLVRRRLRK
jgi:hypothetical protein